VYNRTEIRMESDAKKKKQVLSKREVVSDPWHKNSERTCGTFCFALTKLFVLTLDFFFCLLKHISQ
jgi:hypothetical protein